MSDKKDLTQIQDFAKSSDFDFGADFGDIKFNDIPEDKNQESLSSETPELPNDYSEKEITQKFENFANANEPTQKLQNQNSEFEQDDLSSDENVVNNEEAEISEEKLSAEENENNDFPSIEEEKSLQASKESLGMGTLKAVSSQQEESSLLDELEAEELSESVEKEIQKEKELPQKASFTPIEETRETFKDVQSFAKKVEGTSSEAIQKPMFSVMFKDIKYKEDVDKILTFFETHDYGISQEDVKRQLTFGALLVSRVTEYMAVFAATELRDVNCSMKIGLSDLVYSAKSIGGENPVNFISLTNRNEKAEGLNLDALPEHAKDVIISSSSNIDGYEIANFLSFIIASKNVADSEVAGSSLIDDDEDISSRFNKVVENLISELKRKALTINANAVVGVTTNIAPILSDSFSGKARYKISVTGNAVRTKKRN